MADLTAEVLDELERLRKEREDARAAGATHAAMRHDPDSFRRVREANDEWEMMVMDHAPALLAAARRDAEANELPYCPLCGYTREDERFHGDHHLCDGKIPQTDRERISSLEAALKELRDLAEHKRLLTMRHRARVDALLGEG